MPGSWIDRRGGGIKGYGISVLLGEEVVEICCKAVNIFDPLKMVQMIENRLITLYYVCQCSKKMWSFE